MLYRGLSVPICICGLRLSTCLPTAHTIMQMTKPQTCDFMMNFEFSKLLKALKFNSKYWWQGNSHESIFQFFVTICIVFMMSILRNRLTFAFMVMVNYDLVIISDNLKARDAFSASKPNRLGGGLRQLDCEIFSMLFLAAIIPSQWDPF